MKRRFQGVVGFELISFYDALHALVICWRKTGQDDEFELSSTRLRNLLTRVSSGKAKCSLLAERGLRCLAVSPGQVRRAWWWLDEHVESLHIPFGGAIPTSASRKGDEDSGGL